MVYGLSAASVAKRINTEGQAAQLLAIMQARLRSLASSASGHERMVNARAASGEKTIDFSEQIAWFGDILKEWGRSSRSGPVCSLTNRPLVTGSMPPIGAKGQIAESLFELTPCVEIRFFENSKNRKNVAFRSMLTLAGRGRSR